MKNGLYIERGTSYYYLNGKFHREDGPAIEWADGDKSWYRHGELHREDGPAIEYGKTARKRYFLNDVELFSEQDYLKEMKKRKSLSYIFSNIKKDKII
jgi:hypothetical protein